MIPVEQNELIARFMGLRVEKGVVYLDDAFGGNFDSVVLKYHESWDSLMPVIEKINRHVYEVINVDDGITKHQETDRAHLRTFGLMTDDEPPRRMVRFNRAQLHFGATLIEAAHCAVVTWITDFNEGTYNYTTP